MTSRGSGLWAEEGWLYLAALVDVYSSKVVGWAMSGIRDEQLVENALWMALVSRQQGAALLHHSDQGSQYTARSYRGMLKHYGIELSMSRPGNCWDNALCKSFFGNLKVECTDRYRFTTRQQAQIVIFEYLEVFYNRHRLHSALGYTSPTQFEKNSASVTP